MPGLRTRKGQKEMGMNVGVCRLTLRLPGNHDVKGKRRVLRSVCDRVRKRFNVAAAEVGDADSWQAATLGVVCVSNSSRHADEMMSKVVSYIEGSREDLEVVSQEQEIITGF